MFGITRFLYYFVTIKDSLPVIPILGIVKPRLGHVEVLGLRPAFISFPVLSPVLVFARHSSGSYGN